MKTETMTVQYDSEKLAALRLYAEQKHLDIEAELTLAMDTLYTKIVPSNVREYIDIKNGIETVSKKKPKKAQSAACAPTE